MPKKRDARGPVPLPPPEKPFIAKAGATEGHLAEAAPPASVSREDAASGLAGYAQNWSEDVKAALALPARLYRREAGNAITLSDDAGFGINAVLARFLSSGHMDRKPDMGYGIAVYETTSTVYLVLADMGRRIMVREPLMRYMDKPQKKDWAEVAGAIRAAEAAAKAKPGRVAVSDCGDMYLV
ncbi:MAG: hypothetical protein AB1529_02200 [Candidatus Micrarchaeota archaeon]